MKWLLMIVVYVIAIFGWLVLSDKFSKDKEP
jgi:hypothetical protein